MTSQGSPHGQLQHALERGNVLAALAAARELGWVSLSEALALCVLLAEKDPDRFDFAAVRWHARYVLEVKRVPLGESQLVLASLSGLLGPAASAGAETLLAVARARGLNGFDAALRPLLR